MAKYRKVSNRALYDAMMEKRRSSAASPYQDQRTKRARTREAKLQKEIKDQDG